MKHINRFSLMILGLAIACSSSDDPDDAGVDVIHDTRPIDVVTVEDSGTDSSLDANPVDDSGLLGDGDDDDALTELGTHRFEASYGDEFGILGAEPDAGGRFPVFIYVVGTNGSYTADHATQWIDTMASRGFVAATVDYNNGLFSRCDQLLRRASSIFESTDPSSAASEVCAREAADCTRGVVVAGHSQGSIIALLAAETNDLVVAAVPTGTGYRLGGLAPSFKRCVVDERRLPSDRILAITGASDPVWGGVEAKVEQLNAITGLSCPPSEESCTSGVAGWHLIPNDALGDGNADHCFFAIGDNCGMPLDPQWVHGGAPWAMPALAAFMESWIDE